MKIQMKSPLSHRHTWHRPSPRWSCYLWVPSCANLWPRRSVPGWKIPMFGPFVTWRWSKTPNTSSIFFLSIYQKKEYIQVSLGKSTPNFVLVTEHFPHTQAALPWSGCASWFPCSGSAWGAPLRVPRCVRKGGSPVGMMLWNHEDFCRYLEGGQCTHVCILLCIYTYICYLWFFV